MIPNELPGAPSALTDSTAAAAGVSPAAALASAGTYATRAPGWHDRLLATLKREPVLFLTTGYVFISILGLWSSYWYFRGFGFPILQYMQTSDFFVAGVRRPAYLLVVAYALGCMWLCTWPLRLLEFRPERAEALRQGTRWGKLFFPAPGKTHYLVRVGTAGVFAVGFLLIVLMMLFAQAYGQASAVREGRKGAQVEVVMGGGTTLQGPTTLLGTSGAFAFVWRGGRAEALPIDAIERISTLPDAARGNRAPASGPGDGEQRP